KVAARPAAERSANVVIGPVASDLQQEVVGVVGDRRAGFAVGRIRSRGDDCRTGIRNEKVGVTARPLPDYAGVRARRVGPKISEPSIGSRTPETVKNAEAQLLVGASVGRRDAAERYGTAEDDRFA